MMGRHGYSNLLVLIQKVNMVTRVEQKQRIDQVIVQPRAKRLASSVKKDMLLGGQVWLETVESGVGVAVAVGENEMLGVGEGTTSVMQSLVGYLLYRDKV